MIAQNAILGNGIDIGVGTKLFTRFDFRRYLQTRMWSTYVRTHYNKRIPQLIFRIIFLLRIQFATDTKQKTSENTKQIVLCLFLCNMILDAWRKTASGEIATLYTTCRCINWLAKKNKEADDNCNTQQRIKTVMIQ